MLIGPSVQLAANNLHFGKGAAWISKLLNSKEKERRNAVPLNERFHEKLSFCYACLFQVLLENCLSITSEVNVFVCCIANMSPGYNSWVCPISY